MNGIILMLIMLVTLFIILRISWINLMIDDWNYNLNLYLEYQTNKSEIPESIIKYYKSCFFKPRKYYLRFKYWNINSILRDPLLMYDIQKFMRNRNKEYFR